MRENGFSKLMTSQPGKQIIAIGTQCQTPPFWGQLSVPHFEKEGGEKNNECLRGLKDPLSQILGERTPINMLKAPFDMSI